MTLDVEHLGDMGVHIFDTPYNALNLDVPLTIKNKCRKPNGFGFPENNYVEYEFPGTQYTTEKLTWIWEDGKGSPSNHKDLKLPNKDKLPLTRGDVYWRKWKKASFTPFYGITKIH